MSASLPECPTAPLLLQPESDYHRTLHDLTIATATLEFVTDCEEAPADLRRLADVAYRRLFDVAGRLKRWKQSEAWSQSATTRLSPAD